MNSTYRFTPGSTPILISIPHAGTHVPAELAARMTDIALSMPDTDWHVETLYDFAPNLGASMIVATSSRYVIDLNRDPSGVPLYPGADNTELVPLSTFGREPIYRPGAGPDEAEIGQRVERYWRPYHERLNAELDSLKRRFGIAVLWDAHSIPSLVPRFFSGRLPDLNLGSARGESAAPALVAKAKAVLNGPRFTSVCDGRFTGGYITRRYGRPAEGMHALQLELAQVAYMDEAPPYRYDPARAAPSKAVLEKTIGALIAWARENAPPMS